MNKFKLKINNYIPYSLVFLFKIYFLGIIIFTLYRLGLLLSNLSLLSDVPAKYTYMAFLQGLRFDTVISGYILIFPFILSMALSLIPIRQFFLKYLIFIILSIFYILSFAVCTTDIPYFMHFSSRITLAILNWTGASSMAFKFVIENPVYYAPIIGFFVFSTIFVILIRKQLKKWIEQDKIFIISWKKRLNFGLVYLLAALCLFIGIRGRVDTLSPIRWGTALFSPYPFPNQLALNPVFTFFDSMIYQRDLEKNNKKMMDDSTAANYIHNFLCGPTQTGFQSPIARMVKPEKDAKKYNVVLILMESMSAEFLASSGNFNPSVTPFLDSLSNNALYFNNMYSSGIHTFMGTWSVFLGMPPIPTSENLLLNPENMHQFSGLPVTLFKNGYSTFFAMTHDSQFDNMGGLLSNNGFEQVISQKDYFDAEALSSMGIPDNVLFDRSLPYLRELASKPKPFFAAMLTVSNHGPWRVPEHLPPGFNPKHTEKKLLACEYADWSLRYFINKARREPWFNNTIFVFVADHGVNIVPSYEICLGYHHIPLIIYAPNIIKPQVISGFAQQEDIFPTIMHFLDIEYINNTFGMDLMKRQRDFSFFCTDTKIGAINDSLFLMIKESGDMSMYKYKEKSFENHISKHKNLVDSMKYRSYATFQTAIRMIKQQKVSLDKVKSVMK
ncbi:MAG: sulfatase [Ignavibacteria bacterium]|nr:sulfatase [Ignavibacteria bacterium]